MTLIPWFLNLLIIVFKTEPLKTTSSAKMICVSPIDSKSSDICFICLSTACLSVGLVLETRSLLLSKRVQSRKIIDELSIVR